MKYEDRSRRNSPLRYRMNKIAFVQGSCWGFKCYLVNGYLWKVRDAWHMRDTDAIWLTLFSRNSYWENFPSGRNRWKISWKEWFARWNLDFDVAVEGRKDVDCSIMHWFLKGGLYFFVHLWLERKRGGRPNTICPCWGMGPKLTLSEREEKGKGRGSKVNLIGKRRKGSWS